MSSPKPPDATNLTSGADRANPAGRADRVDLGRRRAMRLLGVAAGGMATALLGGAYAGLIEPRRLQVERVRLPVAGLPAALDGLRIVQLSDFHIEPYTGAAFLERAVAASNRLEPDVVALTGDFVTARADAIADLAPILGALRARLGVFACLGNHDVWSGPRTITRALEAAGVPVLRNDGVTLGAADARLHLAGIDSAWGGRPNLDHALIGAPDGVPVILLAHEPDLIDGPLHSDRVALQLSGHSHGGQVRVPGVGALILPYLGRRYDLGLYRVGESWLYTNRGVGSSGVPLRFNCPPELTEITLVTESAEKPLDAAS